MKCARRPSIIDSQAVPFSLPQPAFALKLGLQALAPSLRLHSSPLRRQSFFFSRSSGSSSSSPPPPLPPLPLFLPIRFPLCYNSTHLRLAVSLVGILSPVLVLFLFLSSSRYLLPPFAFALGLHVASPLLILIIAFLAAVTAKHPRHPSALFFSPRRRRLSTV